MEQKISRGGLSATLHDVAARSGVSIATASRALNGLPVSEQARERVRSAAAELGYIANGSARSLRNVRTMTMGAVVRTLGAATGLELLDALTASVEEQGYSLFVSSARGDDAHFDTIMRRMLERRIDAVFCINPRGEAPILEQYRNAGIPVMALLGRGAAFESLPLVATSFRDGAERAVARLMELGHERVAILLSRRGPGALGAVVSACKAAGLEARTEGPLSGPFDPVAYLRQNADSEAPATAVVALYEHVARLREAASQLGIRVPADLSLCAVHHNAGERAVSARSVSGIHVDFELVGRAAAAAMLRWLGGGEPPTDTKVGVASWVERSTTDRAPVNALPGRPYVSFSAPDA